MANVRSMEQAVTNTQDWMAAVRARETNRTDHYLHDPYAALLSTPEADQLLERLQAQRTPAESIIVRGRFTDETLTAAVTGGIRQVVSMSAGTDTRGYRLDLPEDLVLYEVDLPGHLAAKHFQLAAAGLTPSCRISPVETDVLCDDWMAELIAAGYRPHRSTAWILEDLMQHLSPTAADTVIGQLTAHSPSGSTLTLDIAHQADALCPPTWLGSHGWDTEAYLAEELHACPWLPPIPLRLRAGYHEVWHVYAIKR